MGKNIINTLMRRMIHSRKKDFVPVYLKRFETVDRMIASDLIAIDLEKRFVALDASVHLLYMNDLKRYAAFFDTLRAFINYRRGLLGMKEVAYEERIDFTVMIRHSVMSDAATGEVFDPPRDTVQPLIVGFYAQGIVKYAPYEKTS